MKSKLLRILALILVMSSLLSMFAIFATAEEATGEDDENGEAESNPVSLQYARTYDEGWNVLNGLPASTGNNPDGAKFEIDYETQLGEYNYFWRLTLGSVQGNHYLQMTGAKMSDVGSVLEFDIMTDGEISMDNPVLIETVGSSGSRYPLRVISIANNNVSVAGSPAFTLEPEKWMRIQVIFDYTKYEGNFFDIIIHYGPADGTEPMQTKTLTNQEAPSGNGINHIRFQQTGAASDAQNSGQSICFDNIKYYEGTNQIVPITESMGHGLLINENADKDVPILGGSEDTKVDLYSALSMKVGVNYCYTNSTRTPIKTDSDGTVYGAPVEVDGQVMVPLDAVLSYVGFEAKSGQDGIMISVPNGLKPPVHIIVGKKQATLGQGTDATTFELDAAPAYVDLGNGVKYLVIALSDIEKMFSGYYGRYDEMGYIAVSTSPDQIDRSKSLSTMLDIMKKFVFDYYDGDRLYEDVKANTNNFQHPYILANGKQLSDLRAEYEALCAEVEAGTVEVGSEKYWMWKSYQNIVNDGERYYKYYAKAELDGTYDEFVGLLSDAEYQALYSTSEKVVTRGVYSLDYPYADAGGYDMGGRSDIANRTARLESMAFAYALTGDIKYLQLCYEVAMCLGKWEHWGPGHFLNCADSANDFALYYDWTYQGYVELASKNITRPDGSAYDVAALAEILARQGVHEGYLSTIENKCEHVSEVVGTGGHLYSNRDNNWAAVCVGGMTVAALAIFDGHADEVDTDGKEMTYLEEAKKMVAANLQSLLDKGMDIYAPDGAYVEGPGYWNYGTNNFFRMCAVLDSAAGQNYGLMDCWGIDDTCYYACHTEDNNSNYFPYHDGNAGSQDTSYFFYVANYFGDATLYDVRRNQILSGYKVANLVDMIYYPRDIEINADEIKLDYYAESIDLFATRSSWEEGALFASMIGGKNRVSHGQIDAGDFVYHNGGTVWIRDLGTEDYNCTGFWQEQHRYRYYVMKPEGNNTIAITTDPTNTPYGQLLDNVIDGKDLDENGNPKVYEAGAKAERWGSNEYGSYVNYDMQGSLGKQVNFWKRGMMLTNDRKTTVIQDEISFKGVQTAYWFAHYYADTQDTFKGIGVTLSDDGKIAYMRRYMGTDEHGREQYQTLRLTLVSPQSALKFKIMTTYEFVHTAEGKNPSPTYSAGEVLKLGGAAEKSRSSYKKLAICCPEQPKFEVAVVIELIDDTTVGTKKELEVGYQWTGMAGWEPYADTRGQKVETGDTTEKRGLPNIQKHLVSTIKNINENIYDTRFTDDIKYFFRDLSDAYYAVRMIANDMPAGYEKEIAAKDRYVEEFNAYRTAVQKLQKNQLEFIYKLLGVG